MLEITCFVNLLLFCLIQLFILGNNNINVNIIVVNVSVTFTFVLFCGILVYHIFVCLSQSFKCKWRRRPLNEEDEADEPCATLVNKPNKPTYSIVERPTPNESSLPGGIEAKDNSDYSKKSHNNARHSCGEEKHELTSLTTPYKLITF